MTTTKERLPRTRTGTIRGNTDAITDYWVERLLTPMAELESLGLDYDSQSKNSMSYNGDRLIHYGWWTLAKGLRDKRGRTRLVLINADRYGGGSSGFGPGTEQRRASAERAVRDAGLEWLLLPFSALEAAGISHDSIRVLERCDESWDVTCQSVTRAWLDNHAWSLGEHDDGTLSVRDDRCAYQDDVRYPLERDPSDARLYRYPTFRHWLGEAVFSAEVVDRATGNRRRAKFLSAFDHNEQWCYFLCELPRTSARTVTDAFEALKPEAVKRALAAGLDVLRQGDIFAIPTSLTTSELKSRATTHTLQRYEVIGTERVTRTRQWNAETRDYEIVDLPDYLCHDRDIWGHTPYEVKSLRMKELLGTNHIATEQIATTDGDVYARGYLRHRPPHRRPDHTQVKLGDGKAWYRVVKNTVPTANINEGTRSQNQSGQARAWTLGGQVD